MLLKKLRRLFHDDWCPACYAPMQTTARKLFALPNMYAGHYATHTDAAFYLEHLVPVDKKADIPTGIYACGITAMRCPSCGKRAALLTVFLPVRDMEKPEDVVLFKNGELDALMM